MKFISALHIARLGSRQHPAARLRRNYEVENVTQAWLCCPWWSA